MTAVTGRAGDGSPQLHHRRASDEGGQNPQGLFGRAPTPDPTTKRASLRSTVRPRELAQVALLAVPVVVFAVAAWHRRALYDDAFINLRVVREVMAGHGPVFNAGQRVEAVTSPLWLWTLVAGDAVLPIRLEWVAVLLDLALSVAGIGLLMAGSARLTRVRRGAARPGTRRHRRPPPLAIPAGIIVLAALCPMWSYAGSGLENGLCTAWIGLTLFALAGWASGDRPARLRLAAVVGLGPLIRPELGVLSALLLVVVVADPRLRWTRRAALTAAALAAPLGYQVFRMGYYAMLVPNSAVAKSAGLTRWGAGWTYLRASFGPYWIWVPLLALLVGGLVPLVRARWNAGGWRDRRLLVTAAFTVSGLLMMLYVVRVGGDYLHARLLLPGLTALIAPVAVVRWQRRSLAAFAVVPWGIVALAGLRAPADARQFFFARNTNPVTTDDYNFNPPSRGHAAGFLYRVYLRPGRYLNQTYLGPSVPGGPRRVVAEYSVGVSSYALGPDTYVIDLLGLGDPFTSHLRLAHRGLNSHEKPLPMPWLVADLYPPGMLYPEADFVHEPRQSEPLHLGIAQLGTRVEPFTARVAAAREAMRCRKIRDLLDGAEAPLTFGRFFGNLFDSFDNTSTLVPPEPSDAVAWCGPTTRQAGR